MGAFNNVILLTNTNETNPKDIISFYRLYQDYQKRFVRFIYSYIKDLEITEYVTLKL